MKISVADIEIFFQIFSLLASSVALSATESNSAKPAVTSVTSTDSSFIGKQNFNSSVFNFTVHNAPYRRFNLTRRNEGKSGKTLLFKDYIKRFNPNVVFNKIIKRKQALGRNASVTTDFDEIFEGIDATDDLLRLNVEAISGRRKWVPPGHPDTVNSHSKDQFSLRMRLFELIRHTLYRTRNKLVIMQLMRTKYRNSSLYRMGFLMSKTDTACKSFHAFAFRSFHPCLARAYNYYIERYEVISMLHAEERLNNKWFEIELLIDLIRENDENAKEVIAKNQIGRREKWKFLD